MRNGREMREAVLHETLDILRKGEYERGGRTVKLKLAKEEMENAYVLLPGREIVSAVTAAPSAGRTVYEVINTDSFSAARSLMKDPETTGKVLVLNFANAFHPGGGVRSGASAQEEDLCRCSSLLLSLEGNAARPYYEFNRRNADQMGTDGIIFHPAAEIIRDGNYRLLEETEVVSVLTCAAPNIRDGLHGRTEDEYRELFYQRIVRILQAAAAFGCRDLVLGAFGCGAFCNDAGLTAGLFARALRAFAFDGKTSDECFRKVVFAVLDRTDSQYNFRQFSQVFEGAGK